MWMHIRVPHHIANGYEVFLVLCICCWNHHPDKLPISNDCVNHPAACLVFLMSWKGKRSSSGMVACLRLWSPIGRNRNLVIHVSIPILTPIKANKNLFDKNTASNGNTQKICWRKLLTGAMQNQVELGSFLILEAGKGVERNFSDISSNCSLIPRCPGRLKNLRLTLNRLESTLQYPMACYQ